MMRRLSIAIVLLLASTFAAAQFGNVIDRVKKVGDKANDTFAPWSPEQENAIGQASAAKMIHIMGLVEDPALTKYVQYVGSTVARQASRSISWHFAILEARTPDGRETVSAFALPGGYVFLTKGAFDNMTDEAQLAGVLAHEIAHVDGRHLEKSVQRKKTKAWALQAGTAKIPGPSELRNIANDIVGQALLSQPSTGDENDADKKGTQFAAGAGYDPTGLMRFLFILQANEQAGKVTAKDTALWGRSHPPIADRIAKLSSQTSSASGGQILAERLSAAKEGKPVLTGSTAPSTAPAETTSAAPATAETQPAENPAAPADNTAQTAKPAQQKKKKSLSGFGGLIPH